MPEFFRTRTITHHFHFGNKYENTGIGYVIIIVRDIMVQLGMISEFKHTII